MTDNPNLAKMSDAEYSEYVAAQKRSASQDTARVGALVPDRNNALLALQWITGISFVLGLILVIAGAANMNVQVSIFSSATSDPGLPWLIIGGGLLNLGTVCVLALLIVHAVRWRAE